MEHTKPGQESEQLYLEVNNDSMDSPCHFWTGEEGQRPTIAGYTRTWNHHVIFGQERWATSDCFEGRVKENLFPVHIHGITGSRKTYSLPIYIGKIIFKAGSKTTFLHINPRF